MSNIDKIRAEIERMKHYAEESKMEWVNEGYNQNAFAEDCRIKSFDKLLSFLDALEEPVSNDLDEAAEEYASLEYDCHSETDAFYATLQKDAFKAGAEWMEAQFEHCGTFPIEDPRGGYWPTDYYIKKK